MKFLSYLLCVINTALIVMLTIEIIKAENFYHLFIVALFVPMVVFEWYTTMGIHKRKN